MKQTVWIVLALLVTNQVFAAKSGYKVSPGSASVLASKAAVDVVDGCFGQVATPGEKTYRLHAGDTIKVSVWHEPDLLQDLLIRPDGGITFPLAGDVSVAGLTMELAQAAVRERLVKFIPDAQVHITLQSAAGNAAYVIGKVNRPGPVVLSGAVSVVQALSVAGGATVYADTGEIRVIRECGGSQQTFTVNYAEIERGTNLSQNIALQGGDVVVVP
jgi:polysaccharide export outer membrane protein